MDTPYPLCPICDEPLDPEWARSNRVYCSQKCKNRAWYLNHTDHHQRLYAKLKKQWERSPNGKREGIPIRLWLQLPPDWR